MSKGNRYRKRPDRKAEVLARADKGWKEGLRKREAEKDAEWRNEQQPEEGLEHSLADRVWDGHGYRND